MIQKLKSIRTIAATLITFSSLAGGAKAAVLVNFSGGGGTPLTITFPQAITFTLTTSYNGGALILVGVGQSPGYAFAGFTNTSFTSLTDSSPTGSISAAANTFYSNFGLLGDNSAAGSVGGIGIGLAGMSSGETVSFGAGSSISSTENVAATFASGSYNVGLHNIGNGNLISTPAVTIPEPSLTLLLGLGGVGLVARRRRIK
jgi:PEP-CTERM motif